MLINIIMVHLDWRQWLVHWNSELIEQLTRDDPFGTMDDPLVAAEVQDLGITSAILASGWLGYEGATEADLVAAEARLGTVLPPSYRAFLRVTNGWRQPRMSVTRLWATHTIEWFSVRHQADFIDPWIEGGRRQSATSGVTPDASSDAEYFVYGAEQSVLTVRNEYLPTMLEISDIGESAVYLLNPHVRTAEGEWEAWFFASWLPGAMRYQSFQELMDAQRAAFLHAPSW